MAFGLGRGVNPYGQDPRLRCLSVNTALTRASRVLYGVRLGVQGEGLSAR